MTLILNMNKIPLLCVLPSFLIIREFYSIRLVKGDSMLPTLKPKDLVLINHFSSMKLDDLVVLKLPTNSKLEIVKRVVAIEGDVIIRNNNLIDIPEGHIWVEGDSKDSTDSNSFGCVSKGLVLGTVVYKIAL